MRYLNVILFFALVGFLACSDDSGSPVIEISSPQDNEVFSPGQDVVISATVSDDIGITSLQVISSDLGINETITQFQDPTLFSINFTITLDPATPAGEYNIDIVAIDGDGNRDEKNLTIKIE